MRQSSQLGFIGALALALAACAAPAAPSPTAAPAKPAEKAAAPAEKAAAPAEKAAAPAASTGADAAWQKIVDAAKNEKLTVYGRLLSGPEGTVIAEAVKKDTGLSVEFVAGAGSPMFSRIKEESKAGRPTADIYEGSQPWPSNIEREGFFAKLKDLPIPALQEPASTWSIDPWFMSPDGFYLATRFSDFESHVVVNSKVVPEADFPKNWQEYSNDPKYAGKISWVDPKTTQDIGSIWSRHGYVGKGLKIEDLWSIYNKQKPQLFPNPVDASSAIGRGEAGLGTSATGLLPAVSAGAPIKLLLFPETPSVSLISGMGIIKDSPNMNASMVFVNWVMSKQGMEVIAKVNQAKTIRKDVPSGVPDGMKSEVVNNGKKGPSYALSAAQAALAGEVEAAGVMRMLTEGASLEAFKAGYETFIKEWESKRGGPQDKPVVLQD
ncbi:MAG: ABC transporter substrate-binding protein [Chloroflexota bacterium]